MPDLAVKERPILFSAPMIKALLEGRKTQTRRVVKPQGPLQPECWDNCIVQLTDGHSGRGFYVWDEGYEDEGSYFLKCPYAGYRLWVKETWYDDNGVRHTEPRPIKPDEDVYYRADGEASAQFEDTHQFRWTPSIHMPRWASRITLEITDVRVQRVEEISEEDAEAEGVTPVPVRPIGGGLVPDESYREGFLRLFYDINKRAKRGENPFVWVIGFKVRRLREPGAEPGVQNLRGRATRA